MQRYHVQSNWEGSGWKDEHELGYVNLTHALDLFNSRVSDHIWVQTGRRKWRIVKRTITEDVIRED